jgi:methylisocitrate lyase
MGVNVKRGGSCNRSGDCVSLNARFRPVTADLEDSMPSPGERLRQAWAERPIMIPGAFNALTAKLAERLGFAAVYLSGGALSAGWAGLPDIGLLTQIEFAEQAAVLVRATALPVLCDADTGFGETINVERTVRLFEEAGVGGLHLEDQVLPKRCGHLSGKAVIETSAMVTKVRAAVGARRDPAFVIVARTDARSVEGFDAALARSRAYVAAGADMVFPEALESASEFARFAELVAAPKLANMTEFGRSPLIDFAELAGMGYRAILYPLTAFRAAMKAAEETLTDLRDRGSQRACLERMQTRTELYELLGYSDWEARDRAYFGGNER